MMEKLSNRERIMMKQMNLGEGFGVYINKKIIMGFKELEKRLNLYFE